MCNSNKKLNTKTIYFCLQNYLVYNIIMGDASSTVAFFRALHTCYPTETSFKLVYYWLYHIWMFFGTVPVPGFLGSPLYFTTMQILVSLEIHFPGVKIFYTVYGPTLLLHFFCNQRGYQFLDFFFVLFFYLQKI